MEERSQKGELAALRVIAGLFGTEAELNTMPLAAQLSSTLKDWCPTLLPFLGT